MPGIDLDLSNCLQDQPVSADLTRSSHVRQLHVVLLSLINIV